MEENKDALDVVNKGCTMGVESINSLIDKVSDPDFRKDLDEELKEYDKIESKIHDIYDKYGKDEPNEIGPINKVVTDSVLGVQTMINYTDSNIAEILLKGNNMGIIEGIKICNNKKLDDEVEEIVEEFVDLQEDTAEKLKDYL